MPYFAAPPMRERLIINPAMSLGSDPIPHQLTRWPGESVQFPILFAPKLRTNASLKVHGFPNENVHAHFQRADTRAFLAHRMASGVRLDTKTNRFGDSRAIPAVYVPTSPANDYRGPTQ